MIFYYHQMNKANNLKMKLNKSKVEKLFYITNNLLYKKSKETNYYINNNLIPSLTESQYEYYNSKIKFIEESGYYTSFKEKAFNIWYDITKIHLLTDGNKRIGLVYFILYCRLSGKDPRIIEYTNDNFTKICIDIAKSNPNDKQKILEQLKTRITFVDKKSIIDLNLYDIKEILYSKREYLESLSKT